MNYETEQLEIGPGGAPGDAGGQAIRPASLKTNAAANALAYAAAVAAALLVSPFLLHRLGDSRYGVLSLSSDLNGYYGLLDIGVRGAVAYYVARHQAKGDWGSSRDTVRTAFWFLAVAAAVVISIGLTVAVYFPKLFNVGNTNPREASLSVAIIVVVFGLNLPFSLPNAILNGVRRIDLIAWTEIGCRTLSACAVYVVLRLGGGLVEVSLAQVGGTMLVWIVLYAQMRRLGLRMPIWPISFSRRASKDLFAVGSANMVFNLSVLLINQMQLIIVGSFLGTAVVAHFSMGRYLPVQFHAFICAFSMTLTTAFTHYHTSGLKPELKRIYLSSSRLIGALSCFVAGGIAVFGKPFLTLWIGSKYTSGPLLSRSDVILLILLFATLPRTFLNVSAQYLLGSRRLRFLTVLRSVEAGVNVLLSLLLVRWLGPVGVALGTAIPMIVTHVVFLLPYSLGMLEIPMAAFWREVLRPSMVLGGLTAGSGLLLSSLRTPDSWSVLAAEALVVSVLAMALSWWLVLGEPERATIKVRLRALAGAGGTP